MKPIAAPIVGNDHLNNPRADSGASVLCTHAKNGALRRGNLPEKPLYESFRAIVNI
jgi:hypothetical protein